MTHILRNSVLPACLGAILATAAAAQQAVPVRLDPIPLSPATLAVTGPDGTRTYTNTELEGLPTYRLTTPTPWRSAPADFEGVLLRDVLIENGLEDAPAIAVVAENDFRVTIPRAVWADWPVLLATRVNGAAHQRRERGPIQFVLPHEDTAGLEGIEEGYWVWMAARIEAAS